MDSGVTAAVIAATAAVAGIPLAGFLSHRSAMASVRRGAQQAQINETIKKRAEVYPELWRIHIQYETNWVLDGKPKTGAWAVEYRTALNQLNLDGGVFFSQALYERFDELRRELCEAASQTPPNELVDQDRVAVIRSIVYGERGRLGLSGIQKDDLGSYTRSEIQARLDKS